MFAQQLDQQATVPGIQVLDQYECHAAIRRDVRQKTAERIQPARRGANADD